MRAGLPLAIVAAGPSWTSAFSVAVKRKRPFARDARALEPEVLPDAAGVVGGGEEGLRHRQRAEEPPSSA